MRSNKTIGAAAVRPSTGNAPKRPRRVTFPELELDGVRAVFHPGWDSTGNRAGWTITIKHPIAHALAVADHAMQCVLGYDDTADLWDDLIPTHRRGGECTLQLACDCGTVRAFISALEREGFKVVPGGSKGGAR